MCSSVQTGSIVILHSVRQGKSHSVNRVYSANRGIIRKFHPKNSGFLGFPVRSGYGKTGKSTGPIHCLVMHLN